MEVVSPDTRSPRRGAARKVGTVEAAVRRTLLELFAERVGTSRDRIALLRKVAGTWRSSTFGDWERASREIAAGLVSAGIGSGDRVVIVAETRMEWVECDVGILMTGAICVPIYPSDTPAQCEYIIRDSGARFAFVDNPHQLAKLFDPAARDRLDQLIKVVYFDAVADLDKPDGKGRTALTLADLALGDGRGDLIVSLAELRDRGRAWLEQNSDQLDRLAAAVRPEQIATIVYTSGTTGPPKGVVLRHQNLASQTAPIGHWLGVSERDKQLLFLPLAHIFGRALEWATVSTGASLAFAESIPALVANMGEVKPTVIAGVPRIFEKAYAKIQDNFAAKRKKPIARALVDWALGQGAKRSEMLRQGRPARGLGIRLADRLVFAKIRRTFGGRLRYFVSAGAPLSAEVAEFFHRAGILILEAYGLTETTGAATLNRPSDYRLGSVGPPLPGMEIRLAEDGEILIRGPTVMREYWGKPAETSEVLDGEGWFRSGDIGAFDEDGKLRITDRKKDLIVTAGGKNVAPQNLEGRLKAMCPYVSQVTVHGDRRKFLSALVTLSEEAITSWAAERGLGGDLAALATTSEVQALVRGCIDRLNADLAPYENIRKFRILPRDFSQESGELTPTLKVKRRFCAEKYSDILDELYREDAPP